jgi:hypothetical protein
MVNYPSGISTYTPKIADSALVRRFVALGGRGYVALTIWDGSTAIDPDAGSMNLQVWFDDVITPPPTGDDPRGTRVIDASADQISRDDIGRYHYDIGPQYTGNRGVLTAQWTYNVNGTTFTFTDYLQILDQMPLYESLNDSERLLVEQVSWMIGDFYDSTDGGPHLIDEFQTHFDYERLAELAVIATQRFNVIGYPLTSYGFGYGANNPPSEFSGLILLGTYLEVVRHLRDSYVEIPNFVGMNVTYTDRRDYFNRWSQVFSSEWPDYKQMVMRAKYKLLNLGRGSILLAGGIFGSTSGRGLFLFSPYNAWTRAFRFYPAAPAISFPATRIP